MSESNPPPASTARVSQSARDPEKEALPESARESAEE